MTTYILTPDGKSAIRSSDGASVPWDMASNRPLDIGGLAGRIWEQDGSPAPITPPAPTLAEIKATALAALAERRWRAETGGTLVNGATIATDENAQAKIIGAVVAALRDANYSAQWKMPDGSFATLNHDQIIAIGEAVRAYVQACFDREAALAAQINAAADAAAVAAIEVNAGWPQ
jgi:hypothetical protein